MKKNKHIILLSLLLTYICIDLSCYRITFNHAYQEVFAQVNNSYFIHVDLDNNTMYIFNDGEVVKTYSVSGGKYSSPSPLGTWTIVSKALWGEGFGGTWMGFNVPWGKYGIHGTDEPWSIGQDMSEGCIRMYSKDAEEVRKMIPIGTKITIVKGIYGPFGDGFRVLKPGNAGSDLMAVQKRLRSLGYFHGYCNGIYGNDLKRALKKFQKDNGLPISDKISTNEYNKMGFFMME